MPGPHFDRDYSEDVTLSDGTEVTLRLVRATDKELLRGAFDRLSAESRYRRFFAAKDHLSDRELRYLTEVDGADHFALCALASGDGERGLGVARFIRTAGRAESAEAAITVADEAQGKGLGRVLFQRLMAAAWERGVRSFHCEALARNVAVESALRLLAPGVAPTVEGGVMAFDVPLVETPADQPPSAAPRHSPLYRVLTLAAEGLIWLRDQAIGP